MSIPVINVAPLISNFTPSSPSQEAKDVARQLYEACNTWGFFYITGHSVPEEVQHQLVDCAKEFFNLPQEQKQEVSVEKGGTAWRGYMKKGGEGTHGRVDHKEGLYFGLEHPADHPYVKAGLPLHGSNQFPKSIPELKPAVHSYIRNVTALGQTIMDAISIALGLDTHFMRDNYTKDPIILFRAFNYPGGHNLNKEDDKKWGIGEHTDFGLITILKQQSDGLQVLSPEDKWVDVPVVENTFVCNVGDMLDQMTGGRLKSRPHRVINASEADRLSFPFFFDFSWDAKMELLPLAHLPPLSAQEEEESKQRWAKTTFRSVTGTWAQYLAKKVQKVFPDLNLPDFEPNVASSTRFTLPISTAN